MNNADKQTGKRAVARASAAAERTAPAEVDEADVATHLEETIAEDATAAPCQVQIDTRDVSTPVTRPSIEVEKDEATALLNHDDHRYVSLAELGVGGSALVYSAHDTYFDRDVAVKILHHDQKSNKKRIERFLHEARMTAKLEHPNILPVFDMHTDDDGACYFTMRKAEGISLRDAITELEHNATAKNKISTFNDRINVFINICDAIAYAHDKGIVHRDIKPENVMLGRFGEVVVVDWGSAISEEEARRQSGRLVGTPVYMSPEQARREVTTKLSDIFSLGTTLFHVLTLRHYVWSTDPDEFWQKVKSGDRDPITDAERRQIPPRLLAIAEKAMAHDPSQRYQSVTDLIDDLRHYQEGQSVSAYQDSFIDIVSRWYRQNRKIFWLGVCSLVCVGLAVLAWYNEKLKELRSWQLVIDENFDNTNLSDLDKDWTFTYFHMWNEKSKNDVGLDEKQNRLQIQDGQLLLRGELADGCYNLINKQPLGENIKITYDFIPTKAYGNYNLFFGGTHRHNGYILHLAGHGNEKHIVLTRPGLGAFLSINDLPQKFQLHQTYRVEVVKEQQTITLSIDGDKKITYRDLEVLRGPEHQQFGFEASSGDFLIDNLKVYRQALPQKINPLAVAHAFYHEGNYQRALEVYRSLFLAYPDTQIGSMAQLGQGRSLLKMGQLQEALELFKDLIQQRPNSDVYALALFEMLYVYTTELDKEGLMKTAERMAAFRSGHEIKTPFYFIFVQGLMRSYELRNQQDPVYLHRDLKERVMEVYRIINAYGDLFHVEPKMRRTAHSLASILNSLGEHELVLSLPVVADHSVRRALSSLGRFDELERRFGNDLGTRLLLLYRAGRYEEMERLDPERFYDHYEHVMIEQGRYDELFERKKGSRGFMASHYLREHNYQKVYDEYKDIVHAWLMAANALGHYQEVADANVNQFWERAHAMHMLGQERELLQQAFYPKDAATRMTTYLRLAIKAHMHSDEQEQIQFLDKIRAVTLHSGSPIEVVEAMEPAVRYLDGTEKGRQAMRQWLQQRRVLVHGKWGNDRYHLNQFLLGEMDLAAYCQSDKPSRAEPSLMIQGIRSELQGDIKTALSQYQAHIDEQRNDNTLLIFAKWRIRVLKQVIEE